MKILLAEDDYTSLVMLTTVLERAGHDVVKVSDGVSALEAMRQPESPRIAILDWMMPEMDGIEVVRQLRGAPCRIRPYVIMLTTKSGVEDVAAALADGADDYLTKPFKAPELLARLDVGARLLAVQEKLDAKVAELETALEQNRVLRGILPICAKCKKIRDDVGQWHQIEVYVQKHTDADFSHGICPTCLAKLYPDLDAHKNEEQK